jgi:hypothetical protein
VVPYIITSQSSSTLINKNSLVPSGVKKKKHFSEPLILSLKKHCLCQDLSALCANAEIHYEEANYIGTALLV